MRMFATSDLHADFADDTLVVAGDEAPRLQTVEIAFKGLVERFAAVFHVPGNHELWVRVESNESLEKFERVLELCHALVSITRCAPAASGGPRRFFHTTRDLDTADAGLSAWGEFSLLRLAGGGGPARPDLRRTSGGY